MLELIYQSKKATHEGHISTLASLREDIKVKTAEVKNLEKDYDRVPNELNQARWMKSLLIIMTTLSTSPLFAENVASNLGSLRKGKAVKEEDHKA